ncbi:MAG TPA: hypothetical protein VK563_11105 [Puia sp.]|nr:hypothetical protein [Puia sp.]
MVTFAGVFFSLISIFGLVRCQSKGSLRKIVLVAFSVFLIGVQILFINSVLEVGGDLFIALSGLMSGIILILSFQKNEPG